MTLAVLVHANRPYFRGSITAAPASLWRLVEHAEGTLNKEAIWLGYGEQNDDNC